MKRIDFLFFEKANFPCIEPLIHRLKERARLNTLCVTGFDYKEAAGLISPLELPHSVNVLDIFSLAPALPEPELSRAVEKQKQALLGGASSAWFEMLREEPYWTTILAARERVARALVTFAERFRPQQIVIPDDVHYIQGRLAAKILRPFGVKVWVVVAPYYQIVLPCPQRGPRLGDHYFVMNESVRAELLGDNLTESAVSVVGNPYFIGPAKPRRGPGRALCLARQETPGDEALTDDFIEVAGSFRKIKFIVKSHPSARHSFSYRREAPANVQFVEQGTIADLLPDVGGMVAASSVALYQAAFLGLPLVVANYGWGLPEVRIPSEKDVRIVSDRETLSAAVAEYAERPWKIERPEAWLADSDCGTDHLLNFFEAHAT